MKSVLWRVVKCLSYIEEAQCLKVKESEFQSIQRISTLNSYYNNLYVGLPRYVSPSRVTDKISQNTITAGILYLSAVLSCAVLNTCLFETCRGLK